MAEPRSVQSPLLVGRDDMLALGERRIAEARSGRGGLLLLAGEAGIGKTRLLRALIRQATLTGFRSAKGDIAPQDSLVPLASIHDLARSMEPKAFGDLGPELFGLRGGRGMDNLASRRILVHEIAEKLADAIDRPTLLAFEDLQWADELTLEVVGELARQAPTRPLLLLGAYRFDELPSGSIHREWRSRLLTQRLGEELRLERLNAAETALITTLILGTGLPASREVADAIHVRTNGIPLYIEELLAAIGDSARDSRSIWDAAVPDTIEDAVLARIRRLSQEAQTVARAASVMGRCFVPEVLAGVMDRAVADLDGPLSELVESSILYPFEYVDHGYYDFRHQLLRDAIYTTVPHSELRRMHARAGEFGADLVGANEIHASQHFERAGLRVQAHRAALAGARKAAAMSSRFEAFELYRRAVANLPDELPAAEKGQLYSEFMDAASAVDSIPAMDEASRAARAHFLEAGDALRAANALQVQYVIARRDVRPRREKLALVEQVEAELLACPPSPDRSSLLSQVRVDQAVLELEVGRLDASIERFEQARAEGLAAGDNVLDIESMLAIPKAMGGRAREGLATMLDVARRARDARLESAGVTGYRMAAATAIRLMEYPMAGIGLQEGLRYADEIEQSYCRSIMAAASAHASWAAGRWDEAVRIAELELVEPGSRRGILTARNALAYVALGRGLPERARALLDESLAVARPAHESELILPALWGLAETALVAGDPTRAEQHCDEALELALQTSDGPGLVPFVVTGIRAALASRRPEAAQRWLDHVAPPLRPWAELAGPALAHAEGLLKLAGGSLVAARASLESAVTGWDARGRIWEATWARVDLATCLLRASRYVDAVKVITWVEATAQELSSPPLQERVAELRRQSRGRSAEDEPWHPLTVREFEVAKLIAAGRTNAQIADELFVSPKTVSAHVEHILAKLGAARRAEVAAWVTGVASPMAQPVA